jgi:hyperosmotically inducible periplasmic protein
MSLFRTIVTLCAMTVLTVVGPAIAAPKPAVGTATTTSDATRISTHLQRNLSTLPWYGIFDNLEFKINGSQVILSGQVTSEHAITKQDAENVAKRIPGVTSVVNHIEVLPPSPFDSQLRRAAYRTIFSQSDLGRYTMGANPPVHIVVKNGHLILEGFVMNQMDKTIAGLAAQSVAGLFSVTNNLRIG